MPQAASRVYGVIMLDINSREEEILKFWESSRVYETIKEANKAGKKYYFLDGPPYVTGSLGSYHIWVETVKDSVLRYKRYKGFFVHDRAGFDVHGLPIEHKVESNLKLKSKDDIEKGIGIAKFIAECKEYADLQMASAIKTYKRFGSSLDFKNVYLPYKNEYIDKAWRAIAAMHKKGLLYRGKASLAYCPHCETVLSSQGPEIEYADATDPSIFVKFEVIDRPEGGIEIGDNTYLVIWTTTPWTIPSNIAVAANPDAIYVFASSGTEHYIVAKDRLDMFIESIGKSMVVEKEVYGAELLGLHYKNPLEQKIKMQKEFRKYHKVLLSKSLVSLGEGTGLVHIAPGHGPEDYRLGVEYKLPIFSPVDQHARYTEDAGAFAGMAVPEEANKAVISALKEAGALLFLGSITHSYPHCWRCNSKLIFRATDQWFINIKKIKARTVRENRKVKWHPQAAQKWQEETLENSPDWCISRQRYWGTPIPIWECHKCGNIEVIGSVEELKRVAGLQSVPQDLHKPHIDKITLKCKKCDGTMHRVPDIFDVWYDSGVAHTASLSEEEFKKLFPADWITESRDQIRGWFSVLLRTSVAMYGRSPFKEVTIGGIIFDELGREMHRHLGNVVLAEDMLSVISADGFRVWCLSKPRWQDIKLKRKDLQEANNNIITVYNIAELAKEMASLSGIDPKEVKRPRLSKAPPEDIWIVSKLNSLVEYVTYNMDRYEIDASTNAIRNFIIEDMSRFYLKLLKKRTESSSKADLRMAANNFLYVLRNILIVSSIAMPFSAEYAYKELFSKTGRSIFQEKWPKPSMKQVNKAAEGDFEVAKEISSAILAIREKEGVKLRQPISSATVETASDSVVESLERLSGLIESYANIKTLKIVKSPSSTKEIRPSFQKIGPDFKESANAVAEAIKSADPDALLSEIDRSGHYQLHTGSGTFAISPEHFIVLEKPAAEGSMHTKYGTIRIDSKITEALKEELFVREIIRAVQSMRKELGMKKTEGISLCIILDAGSSEMVSKHLGEIKSIVRAKNARILDSRDKMKEKTELSKSLSLDNINVELCISRQGKTQDEEN